MLNKEEIEENIKDLKHRIKIKDYDDNTEKLIFKSMIQAYEAVLEVDDEKYFI